jgi:hypothetical protein
MVASISAKRAGNMMFPMAISRNVTFPANSTKLPPPVARTLPSGLNAIAKAPKPSAANVAVFSQRPSPTTVPHPSPDEA